MQHPTNYDRGQALKPMKFSDFKLKAHAADSGGMKNIISFLRDESGGEVLEYALIAGLIVVAAIATIGAVGGKVLASWNSLNSSM